MVRLKYDHDEMNDLKKVKTSYYSRSMHSSKYQVPKHYSHVFITNNHKKHRTQASIKLYS